LTPKDSRLTFASKLSEFGSSEETRTEVQEARRELAEFAKRFPFRARPESIEDLKPSDVYEKGSRDSLFYWVEYGTSNVGRITVYGASIFENARAKLSELKRLLKIAADDSLSLHEKIDAPWDTFRGFGGDRHIAKKIVTFLYPDKVLPVFRTAHFEHFASGLGQDPNRATKQLFNKDYENSSVGEKFEALNHLISKWRDDSAPGIDNIAVKRFLYHEFTPPSAETVTDQVGTLGSTGLLFEPENELGVVSIFSMYHQELGFPFIVKIQNGFPDATVISDEADTVIIEFEHKASNFLQHGHPADGCDLVVCWENDYPQGIGPEVLALKEKIKDIMKNRLPE